MDEPLIQKGKFFPWKLQAQNHGLKGNWTVELMNSTSIWWANFHCLLPVLFKMIMMAFGWNLWGNATLKISWDSSELEGRTVVLFWHQVLCLLRGCHVKSLISCIKSSHLALHTESNRNFSILQLLLWFISS